MLKSIQGAQPRPQVVRYGDVTVTVRNPCPPGTHYEQPAPLPGRRSK